MHVPYEGIAQASLDIISGQVNVGFSNVVNLLPYVQDKSTNALAVTGTERASVLPDVATLAETYPGIDVRLWWGIFAPAGTPDDVVAKLNSEINVALQDKALIDQWAEFRDDDRRKLARRVPRAGRKRRRKVGQGHHDRRHHHRVVRSIAEGVLLSAIPPQSRNFSRRTHRWA